MKISDPFRSPGGFPLLHFRFFLYRLFCLWWFCSGLALNECSLVGRRVPATELYVGFWDALRPGEADSPRLQFVTRLPDSPKMEAKGVVLVRGSWYETLGSLGLPFDVNQSLVFPCLS